MNMSQFSFLPLPSCKSLRTLLTVSQCVCITFLLHIRCSLNMVIPVNHESGQTLGILGVNLMIIPAGIVLHRENYIQKKSTRIQLELVGECNVLLWYDNMRVTSIILPPLLTLLSILGLFTVDIFQPFSAHFQLHFFFHFCMFGRRIVRMIWKMKWKMMWKMATVNTLESNLLFGTAGSTWHI